MAWLSTPERNDSNDNLNKWPKSIWWDDKHHVVAFDGPSFDHNMDYRLSWADLIQSNYARRYFVSFQWMNFASSLNWTRLFIRRDSLHFLETKWTRLTNQTPEFTVCSSGESHSSIEKKSESIQNPPKNAHALTEIFPTAQISNYPVGHLFNEWQTTCRFQFRLSLVLVNTTSPVIVCAVDVSNLILCRNRCFPLWREFKRDTFEKCFLFDCLFQLKCAIEC